MTEPQIFLQTNNFFGEVEFSNEEYDYDCRQMMKRSNITEAIYYADTFPVIVKHFNGNTLIGISVITNMNYVFKIKKEKKNEASTT